MNSDELTAHMIRLENAALILAASCGRQDILREVGIERQLKLNRVAEQIAQKAALTTAEQGQQSANNEEKGGTGD